MTYQATIEWLTAIANTEDNGYWIGNISPTDLNILFKRDLVEWLTTASEYFVLTKYGEQVRYAHECMINA